MASIASGGVSLRAIYFEDSQLAFHLAAGITKADEGKAVTIDTSGPNKVKLAGADDAVFGRLEVVEDRTVEGLLVGTVAVRFSDQLPVASGQTITVGQTVVGAGNGEVKAAATPNLAANVVVEVGAGYVVVLKT